MNFKLIFHQTSHYCSHVQIRIFFTSNLSFIVKYSYVIHMMNNSKEKFMLENQRIKSKNISHHIQSLLKLYDTKFVKCYPKSIFPFSVITIITIIKVKFRQHLLPVHRRDFLPLTVKVMLTCSRILADLMDPLMRHRLVSFDHRYRDPSRVSEIFFRTII